MGIHFEFLPPSRQDQAAQTAPHYNGDVDMENDMAHLVLPGETITTDTAFMRLVGGGGGGFLFFFFFFFF